MVRVSNEGKKVGHEGQEGTCHLIGPFSLQAMGGSDIFICLVETLWQS